MSQKRGLAGIAVLLIVALTCVASAQNANRANAQSTQDTPTVKVDVEMVLVTATVTSDRGQYVSGLEREHFQVWEDKVEQEIIHFSSEDVPMSVGVIFDISGSMKEKLPTAKEAFATFLKGGDLGDEYSAIEFADRPRVVSEFTSDIAKLQSRLMFQQAKGLTALYDAVYLGLDQLKDANNPKKALLLITDGEDNRSRYHFSNVKEFVKEQDVQIYAIGIVNDWNSQLGAGRQGRALIEELSELTGGRSFFPESVYDLEDISEKIAVELKNQYVFGYLTTNKAKDGKWRKLRVKVNRPEGVTSNLNVRARTGYYAPAGSPNGSSKD